MLATHFIKHAGDVAEYEQFRNLFTETPEFAFDVATALIGQGKAEKAPSKLVLSKKRKRFCAPAVDVKTCRDLRAICGLEWTI